VTAFEKNREREFHSNIYTKLKPKEMSHHFNNENSDVRYETTAGFNQKTYTLKSAFSNYEKSDPLDMIGQSTNEQCLIDAKRIFKNDIIK
jgi:hypothetical protein